VDEPQLLLASRLPQIQASGVSPLSTPHSLTHLARCRADCRRDVRAGRSINGLPRGCRNAANEAKIQSDSSMKPLPWLLVPFVLNLVYGFYI